MFDFDKGSLRKLKLPLMVSDNSQGTAFTVSIEASSGVTTGISAADRAHTILRAVRKEAKPEDLKQPGHVFPLMARDGGSFQERVIQRQVVIWLTCWSTSVLSYL